MHREHRKPWSRTGSVLSSRWSSCAINPDPAPSPDPQPSPDDDDDKLQVWAGGNDLHPNPSSQLYIQALADAACGSTGECFSALYSEVKDFEEPYKVSSSPSGSVPPRIGCQSARPFKAAKAKVGLEVFMLTPQHETVGKVSNSFCTRHLYFSWLDDTQYNALRLEPDAQSQWPAYHPSHHKMLWFDSQPQFRIKQPFVQVKGSIRAKTSETIKWKEVRATLFGIVGESGNSTPRTWAWSQPAVELENGEWVFGKPPCGTFEGVDGAAPSEPVLETFVVGWGRYEYRGAQFAAVTPPMCAGTFCYRSGVGDWKDGKELPDGDLTPAGYLEMAKGDSKMFASLTFC